MTGCPCICIFCMTRSIRRAYWIKTHASTGWRCRDWTIDVSVANGFWYPPLPGIIRLLFFGPQLFGLDLQLSHRSSSFRWNTLWLCYHTVISIVSIFVRGQQLHLIIGLGVWSGLGPVNILYGGVVTAGSSSALIKALQRGQKRTERLPYLWSKVNEWMHTEKRLGSVIWFQLERINGSTSNSRAMLPIESTACTVAGNGRNLGGWFFLFPSFIDLKTDRMSASCFGFYSRFVSVEGRKS